MSNLGTMISAPTEGALWFTSLANGLSGLCCRVKHSVFCDSSPFQKVEVFETYGYGKVLALAGHLVLTEKDECIYSEMLAHPAMIMHGNPRRVCIIGGGDGGAAREVLKHACVESLTIVEIDELVTRTVRAHFPALRSAFEDPRTTLVVEDGCRYLEKSQERYDVILVDSYAPDGPVQSILSEPFYPLVAAHLGADGIAVFQTDSPTLCQEQIRRTVRNVASSFAGHRLYLAALPTFPGGICSFLAASKQADGLDNFADERYDGIEKKCRCYSREAHQGAFLLPRYVREII